MAALPPAHRILVEALPSVAGEVLQIQGEEARHGAKAKRLRPGEAVQLLDGRGGVAVGEIEGVARERGGARLSVRVTAVDRREPVAPRLVVMAATPKGGRVDALVDSLSQAGAAAWRPLVTSRTVVEPRETKLDRLARVSAEAAKQCGRAWVMEIGEVVRLADALGGSTGGGREGAQKPLATVLADASGGPYEASGAEEIRLLVGPEGGFSEEEVEAARAAGAQVVGFGPHAMRVETAAVAGAAVVLDAERRLRERFGQHGEGGAGRKEEARSQAHQDLRKTRST